MSRPQEEEEGEQDLKPAIDHLLIRRVLRMYNPWCGLQLHSGGFLRDLQMYEPWPEHIDPYKQDREPEYHYGRIRWMMERIRAGHPIDPIEVDNEWSRYGMAPTCLVICDGHHRLIAAALCRCKTIPAIYSGADTILKYLTGERETNPLD